MNRLALIEDYLSGELSPEQEQIFTEQLQHDTTLKSELAFIRDIDTALEESEILDLRMTLQSIAIAESDAESQTVNKTIPIYESRKWILRIAASLLVVIVSSLIFLNRPMTSADAIYQEYFEAYPSLYNVRSAEQPIELQEVIAAMQPYVENDFATAQSNLQALIAKDASRADLIFYLGICQMKLSESGLAVASFDKVIGSEHVLLINHAKWYRALALLEAKQYSQAKQAFSEIADGDSSFSDKAKTIVKKLKRLAKEE